MAERKGRPVTAPPSSLPPVIDDLDADWDDDRTSQLGLELESEDAFDRITAIPSVPAEVFARRVMDAAEEKTAASRSDPVPPVLLSPDTSEPTPAAGGTLRGFPSVDPGPEADETPGGPHHSTLPPPESGPTAKRGEPKLELDFSRAPATPLELADQSVLGRPSTPAPGLELELPRDAGIPARDETAALVDMKDRYAMGDFTGALVIAEGILETNPDDLDARRYAKSCMEVLTQMYTARLGPLTQRVRVVVAQEEIRWLSLDHRAGFLLSLIDGSLTLDEVLDVSGMPRLDALRIMYSLLDQRVIALQSNR